MDRDCDILSAWHLTILHLDGLRLIRPEKAWRPIVSIEIDTDTHETILGADGQNVNQKEVFSFYDARPSSVMDIKIWHRSQSKKKKRKVLVASVSHCLGELLKRQEAEHSGNKNVSIRLQCKPGDRKAVNNASRGRPQGGAILKMRIRPPASFVSDKGRNRFGLKDAEEETDERVKEWEREEDVYDESGTESDDSSVHTHLFDPRPLENDAPLTPTKLRSDEGLRKRRKTLRAFVIDSDDDVGHDTDVSCSTSSSSIAKNGRLDSEASQTLIADQEYSDEFTFRHTTNGEVISFREHETHHSLDGTTTSTIRSWLAFMSDLPLPLYTEKITVPPTLSNPEKVISAFTMYSELAHATQTCNEDVFGKVFVRLQHEWTFVGGLLVALAAVDTAVFSISPDSIFEVSSYARSAIATSSIASGLGIAIDAWFLFRYNFCALPVFIERAKDLPFSDEPTYFFFALTSRVPAFCMLVSAVSLMMFLGLVAFDAYPQGVLVLSFIVGLVMTMQFLMFGAQWFAMRVAKGGRAGGRSVVKVVRVVRRKLSGGE